VKKSKPESEGLAGCLLMVRLQSIFSGLMPFESIYIPASEYTGVYEGIFNFAGRTCFFYNDFPLPGKILLSLLIQGVNKKNMRFTLLT
jgi:hypothetical protein